MDMKELASAIVEEIEARKKSEALARAVNDAKVLIAQWPQRAEATRKALRGEW